MSDVPTTEKQKIAALRGIFVTAGVLIIAYALYGYLSDKIAVFSGKGRGTGTQYVHGAQVLLAAIGYACFAAAAFIIAATRIDRPGNVGGTSWRAIFVLAFVIAGIILVGFRNPN
jgi:hypothetical protein